MITDKEKKRHEELLRLIKENPDLPVVPMVSAEVIGDDDGTWLGSFGSVEIEEYCLGDPTGAPPKIFFRESDDAEDILTDFYGYDVYEKMSDDEIEKAIADLPWEKAIVVYINGCGG